MCIELHFGPATSNIQRPLTRVNSVLSSRSAHWRISCNLCLCLLLGQTGVALDDFVWQHSGDADCGSEEEAQSDAIAHGGLSRFLRLDDHAYRRAGLGHSSAT